MASSEDVIQRPFQAGSESRWYSRFSLSLRLALYLDAAAKKVLPLKGPNRRPIKDTAGCWKDWAGWWTNFRRAGWATWSIPVLVLAKISRSRLISLVRPLALTL